MLAKQSVIDGLAERIERAYRLRRPAWRGFCSSPRVWTVAASTLLEVHGSDPSVPPDPELFVAAQPIDPPYPDPWTELTAPGAVRHYRRWVRAIVRRLRAELSGEVRLAEGRIGAGQPIGKVLSSKSGRLSPLGRFIVAQRAGRSVLASRFLDDALAQHRACPLYREASSELLPSGVYPVPDRGTAPQPMEPAAAYRPRSQAHLN